MIKRGKRYTKVAATVAKETYPVADAIARVKENATAKFDESVEVHVRLAIDSKKGDENVRATVELPHGTGKTVRVAVITATQAKEAQAAGADVVGGEELIDKIKDGSLLSMCDTIVATPEMMPKLAPVAKILGPRGMMPSPKAETVTTNVTTTVAGLKKGKIDFRNDKTGNVHQAIGKASFTAEQLTANYEAFIAALEAAKPAAVKGRFITGITLCSTMGPSVRVR